MATLASRIADVRAALDGLARQHKVPGAALGILHGDERIELPFGVANVNTGVPVTGATLFQIGSNTKVYTATLVMQLLDEGLINLDRPVRAYLPELRLKDAKALAKITVRMLLTHTSGIEGDYFEDFGRGDESIERYVASLKDIGLVTMPGELWSYCNTGWVILGRLVEHLRSAPYHQVLRERLLEPIGATTTTVLMEEMLARSCAVGHVVAPGADPVVPPRVMLPLASTPAGSVTASTAGEVLRFVTMHLDGGRAPNGTQVLSVASAKAMQQSQVKLPDTASGGAMGLGWILNEWDGERVMGHGGGTIGQLSFVQCLPDRRFAVCLLTNATTGGRLWRDLGRFLFDELAGVHMPELPKAPEVAPDIDLAPYAGTYRRLGIDTEITVEEGRIVATLKPTGAMASLVPTQTLTGRPIDKEVFVANVGGDDLLVQFLDLDGDGRPRYVFAGGRVSKRVNARPKKAATRRS